MVTVIEIGMVDDMEIHKNINAIMYGEYDRIVFIFSISPAKMFDISGLLNLGEKYFIDVKKNSHQEGEAYLHVGITPETSRKQLWKETPKAIASQERLRIEDKISELDIDPQHIKSDELVQALRSAGR